MKPRLRMATGTLFVALIALCVVWELWLAPLRPGGSLLVLKVLPLLLILVGVLKADNRSLQWSVLLVWIYVTEGLVRATSDRGLSAVLGAFEVVLCILYFACAAAILRPLKRQARQLAKGEKP
jgi:uncharacterized membrane protein